MTLQTFIELAAKEAGVPVAGVLSRCKEHRFVKVRARVLVALTECGWPALWVSRALGKHHAIAKHWHRLASREPEHYAPSDNLRMLAATVETPQVLTVKVYLSLPCGLLSDEAATLQAGMSKLWEGVFAARSEAVRTAFRKLIAHKP